MHPTCVCVLSCFSRVRLFTTLWTVARQVPLAMRRPTCKELMLNEVWSLINTVQLGLLI